MRKKVLSLLIVFVMLFGIINVQVDAEMLGLTTVASKERGPFAGAVDYAPEEYTFTFEEQKFAFLGGYIGADGVNQGYLEDGGKYYYLVLADANNASDNGGIYEKMPWGVNGDDTVWSVEDESSPVRW